MTLRVLPLNTWPRSVDEPVIVLVESYGEQYPVQLEARLTSGAFSYSNTITLASDGVVEWVIDSAGNIIPNATTIYKLEFYRNGSKIAELPVKRGDNEPTVRIEFRDPAGNPLPLNFAVYDVQRGLLRTGTAQVVYAYSGSKVAVEAWGIDASNRKYYAIAMPQLNDAIWVISPGDKFIFTVEYVLSSSILQKVGQALAKARAAEALEILANMALETLVNKPLALAAMISRQVFDLPVAGAAASIEGGAIRLRVTYEQDLHPALIILAIAAIAGGVGAIIALAIDRIFGGGVVEIDPAKLAREKKALYSDMIATCKALAEQGKVDYVKCIESATNMIEKINTTETAMYVGMIDKASKLEAESSKWKLIAAGAGGAAIAAFIARRA